MDAFTMPLNWQRVRLGDVAEIIGGGTPSTQITSFWSGSINWFTATEIGITKYVYKSQRTITPLGLKKSSAKLLPIGTILLTSRASIGDCAILKVVATTNQDFQSLIPLEKINNEFLYYLTLTLKNKLLKLASGSIFLGVSPNKIKNLLIPLPPLNEQIAIANILSDLDRYLYALDALILKKESVKKALSFELLSQRKRLKGFNQNWQRVRLGDICEFGNGGAYETLIVENGDFKLISLNSIDIDGNLKNTMKRVNFYDNSLKQDDIVMVLSDVAHGDFLGLCAVIPSNDYVLNQRMGRLRKRNDCINILFLRLYINANQKYFKMQGQGSSQLNLSKKAIEDFEILLPPLDEQAAIANILSDVDSEITSLKNKKRQFENIKKALNHDLMSAKIRVLKK
ncbi:restriction endonuclease subunit S [Helicobacter pylori]|uniref:restriction endonuclease subunit S n=1 Tax=Helicobacter pylori TaxID=210 RepID=UPI00167FEEF8|nr:restriction endonuclease subunit S [Helicobacter pylori]